MEKYIKLGLLFGISNTFMFLIGFVLGRVLN